MCLFLKRIQNEKRQRCHQMMILHHFAPLVVECVRLAHTKHAYSCFNQSNQMQPILAQLRLWEATKTHNTRIYRKRLTTQKSRRKRNELSTRTKNQRRRWKDRNWIAHIKHDEWVYLCVSKCVLFLSDICLFHFSFGLLSVNNLCLVRECCMCEYMLDIETKPYAIISASQQKKRHRCASTAYVPLQPMLFRSIIIIIDIIVINVLVVRSLHRVRCSRNL